MVALTFKAGMKFLNKALRGFSMGFWSTYVWGLIDRFLSRLLANMGGESYLERFMTVLFNVVLFVGQAAQGVFNMLGSLVAFVVLYWRQIVVGFVIARQWVKERIFKRRTYTPEGGGEPRLIIDAQYTVVS